MDFSLKNGRPLPQPKTIACSVLLFLKLGTLSLYHPTNRDATVLDFEISYP